MTQTELTTAFLDTLAETATCEEGENHTYKEVAGTYEIKASEDWTLNIPDLPSTTSMGSPIPITLWKRLSRATRPPIPDRKTV